MNQELKKIEEMSRAENFALHLKYIPPNKNIADEPSRGEIQRFVKFKVPGTSVQDGLHEIMLALAENTVMRGSLH